MEDNGEHKSPHVCLEEGEAPPKQVLQVHMPVEVLMNQSVPFPCILVEIWGVPEVLVELSVCKARNVSVEVRDELKHHEEAAEVDQQNGQVEGTEDLSHCHAITQQVWEGDQLTLIQLINE